MIQRRHHDPLEGRLAPWSMPVPVRPADFQSLWPEHEELALQTDMGAIPSFGVTPEGVAERSAHCDFQLVADYPSHRRLGSGRSALYRGKYLKGIGRTPLAANWAQTRDSWHGSGHMQASAAVREFIATRYMEAKGLGHTLVPCEGILVRRMSAELRRGLQEYVDFMGMVLPPIDYELQAISVKPGGFARWSNFLWFLVHAPPSIHTIIDFGFLLESFADPSRPAPVPGGCTPRTIVGAMAAAVDRARESFIAYFRAGVHWGSFCNNSTLDGRFLDLEVPTIIGEARFYGLVHDQVEAIGLINAQPPRVRVLGEGVLDYARQMRAVVAQMRCRLLELAARTATPLARDFAEGIVAEIDAVFHAGHWVFSRQLQLEMMQRLYEHARGPRDLDRAIDSMISEAHGERTTADVIWSHTDLELARPEPAMRSILCVPRGQEHIEHGQAHRERSFINGALQELDSLRTVDELLPALRRCSEELLDVVRPAPEGDESWSFEPRSIERRAS